MTVELLGMKAGANSCSKHLGPIGFKNGTHAKYIQSREFREDNEKGFRPCVKTLPTSNSSGGAGETGGDTPRHGGRTGSRLDEG